MSNSIAPGSSADVNVKVTALTTNSNVPVTYKTIILKKNLVNGVNTLTQEMMNQSNIKYVIKYDFDLANESINIPENCILEFDGGSINNGNLNLNYCLLQGELLFKTCFINNLSGAVNAKNLGLVQGDDISNIIGSGWKNAKVDLQNINLVQHDDILFNGGNFIHITRWNINRINSLSSNNNSRDGEDEAKLQFNGIEDVRIENCTFDGTGSNVDYIPDNFYFDFMGIGLYSCPNAIVRNNIIQNFPAISGIFAELSPNIIIENNYIKNVSIRNKTKIQSDNDTVGDGIYIRTSSTNSIVRNNVVEVENTIQIGRCGVCFEGNVTGVIEYNTVSGYDRAYHIEENRSGKIWVHNNSCTRCVAGILVWRTNGVSCLIENNNISNKGINKENEFDYSPLGKSFGLIDLATSVNYNNELIIRNNTITIFKNGYTINSIYGHAEFNGIIERNIILQGDNNIKSRVLLYNLNSSTGLYAIFNNNFVDGSLVIMKLNKLEMMNNHIRPKQLMYIFINNDTITEDTVGTDLIRIENNCIELDSDESVYQPASCIFGSPICGTIRNNKFPLFVRGYSFFYKIAKGTIIENNIFVRSHSYEDDKIWNDTYARTNLLDGKNFFVDTINNICKVIDNKTNLKVPNNLKGTTTERNALSLISNERGLAFYDETLNKPVWWNGTAWVDATGATV